MEGIRYYIYNVHVVMSMVRDQINEFAKSRRYRLSSIVLNFATF